MQELEHIEVGQQANDGTGDPLRNGMAKVNANFAKVQTGVDAVERLAMTANATAIAGKAVADAAIPSAQKGMANGVAPLGADGLLPTVYLPDVEPSIPLAEKGVAGGVAPLGADGKVPAVNLPAPQDSIPLTQKGVAGGVAALDGAGKVPTAQLPPLVDPGKLASDLAALNSEIQATRTTAFGVDQTIQNVTASRAMGVVYTNTTGRAIAVYFGGTASGGLSNVGIYMGSVPIARCYTESNGSLNGSPVAANAIIPAGQTYRYDAFNISGPVILEYR